MTIEQRELLDRAAFLEGGGDISRFVADAALRAAKTVIEEHNVAIVTDGMRGRLYSLLLDPPEPNAALVELMTAADPEGFEFER